MPDPTNTGAATGTGAETAQATIPAAEKLAVTYSLLTDISRTLQGIFTNPALSSEAIRRIGMGLDRNFIEKLKTANKMTEDQSRAFDKLAASGSRTVQMYGSIGGAAIGASLKVAAMTEKLEDQAARLTRYVRMSDLPGGAGAGKQLFKVALDSQRNYFDLMQNYGKEVAKTGERTYQQLFTVLARAGFTPEQKGKFTEAVSILSEVTGQDMSQEILHFTSNLRRYGVEAGQALDLTTKIYDAWEKGATPASNFNEHWQMINKTAEEFGRVMPKGKAYTEALNLMSTLGANQFGPGQAMRMAGLVSQLRAPGSQLAQQMAASLGRGQDFGAFTREIQGGSAAQNVQMIQHAIQAAAQKANVNPNDPRGLERMILMQGWLKGMEEEDVRDLAAGMVDLSKATERFDADLNHLTVKGKKGVEDLSEAVQKASKPMGTLFTTIAGAIGKLSTEKIPGLGISLAETPKEISYGVGGVIGAGLVFALARRRKMLAALAVSDLVKFAGGESGGSMDLTSLAMLAGMGGMGGGGGAGTTSRGGGFMSRGMDALTSSLFLGGGSGMASTRMGMMMGSRGMRMGTGIASGLLGMQSFGQGHMAQGALETGASFLGPYGLAAILSGRTLGVLGSEGARMFSNRGKIMNTTAGADISELPQWMRNDPKAMAEFMSGARTRQEALEDKYGLVNRVSKGWMGQTMGAEAINTGTNAPMTAIVKFTNDKGDNLGEIAGKAGEQKVIRIHAGGVLGWDEQG